MANPNYQSIYTGKQIDDAIGRILSNEIDELADDAVKAAAQSASSAAAAARSAAAAQTAAGQASNSAAYAAQWATAAADSATAAARSATTASGGAATATRQAAAAADSASAAAQSASGAASSAETAKEQAQAARQYSGKPPVIQNNHWWTWNAAAQRYEDTGQLARGNLMYATFCLNPQTGELYMYTDNEYTGPGFRLAGPDLEVVLHNGG